VIALIPLAFPLVVDTCVLQPPIVTSGETAYALQVFPKGPIVRYCWCAIRSEPWVFSCANKWFRFRDQYLLEGIPRWFPLKTKIQKWIEENEKDFAEAQNKNPNNNTKY
jgi:hypothetical protein